MQYMNDPTLRVEQRDRRGLDVNDIVGAKKNGVHASGSLPPTGPRSRAIAVMPHQMEYDIINPGTDAGKIEAAQMRMSGYGKKVLGSVGGRSNSIAAGTKLVAKQGEANMD